MKKFHEFKMQINGTATEYSIFLLERHKMIGMLIFFSLKFRCY